jgi:hypothetical protein
MYDLIIGGNSGFVNSAQRLIVYCQKCRREIADGDGATKQTNGFECLDIKACHERSSQKEKACY